MRPLDRLTKRSPNGGLCDHGVVVMATATAAVTAQRSRRQEHRRTVAVLAAVCGFLGAALALAVPFLPVAVDDVTLSWPQPGSGANLTAPLVAYAPLDLEATIPCAAATSSGDRDTVIASTIPSSSPNAQKDGLLVVTEAARNGDAARLRITLRNIAVLDVPLDQLTDAGCTIRIASSATETTTTVESASGVAAPVLSGDYRPQMVGIFSDVNPFSTPGLTITAHIDTRFDSSPTPLKVTIIALAIVTTSMSLILLARMDRRAARRRFDLKWRRWPRMSAPDVMVVAILLLWHVIGANTADDGYQLGMARASNDAGYMVNYFRYFGIPETPFGTPYYDLFALLTHVSTASVWMRLPALFLALATWWLISTKVLPRLGAAIGNSRLPLWGAALVFLAFWLPYNNGLRPEPVVALGVLLTWWACERAIATRRLLPVAAAILVAAFTLTAGPSGLICVGALLAASRPIAAIIRSKARDYGYLPVLGPLLAAGLIVLVAVFVDQSIATVAPMIATHDAAGPSLPWFQEYLRYQYLLQDTVDGSPARRFGVFVMIAAVVAATAVLLRRHGIPGLATGPTHRLLGVTAGAIVLMMFTPTKWTHHFGVFAGLTASVAAVLVIAIGPNVLRSRRNQALATAATAFLMALVLTSRNGYWYVSTWGVPWFDKAPSIHGFGVATVFRAITVAALAAALWFHVHDRVGSPQANQPARLSRWRRTSPVVIAAAFMVVLEVASLAKAAVAQYPAYSVARSNIDTLLGRPCGLANDVLVETNPNASLLAPLSADPGTALNAGGATGFTPNGVAADLTSDEDLGTAGTANSVATAAVAASSPTNSAGTGGGRGTLGVNGSSVALPFGLSPRATPVLGSFGSNGPASITTDWYRLPAADSTGHRGNLVAIAIAGRVRSIDRDGISTYGQDLQVELGSTAPTGNVVGRGKVTPIDIGPAPSWRNLRIPLSAIPDDVDVIRIVASDTDLDANQWLAITPPRVPRTTVLNTLLGPQAPVMIDWAVGLNFPCQHLLTLRDGVMQIPQYRILPDRRGAQTTNLWQDAFGGGPMGWIDPLLTARTLPSYLRNDLGRDWGELEQYTARIANSDIAQLQTTRIQRSGLWSPAPIKTG
ncbi:arabinosyltransferase domain-containing protein [Mycolicibacterium sp. YH-1]|uniref:arabinosyltransferase domain-containing protein n=1 Tax=Mycolicibacterium sp. YH-1 TaxID=2908837 RepID=UPI001F4BE5E7|nr:arabinosyltransferase domain-containing protein [Mycolicibacterium sp. YH-1]UNB52895.1 arabinosyltransferase domain-containing protein [Mycolicibacterium sp. YH-1]